MIVPLVVDFVMSRRVPNPFAFVEGRRRRAQGDSISSNAPYAVLLPAHLAPNDRARLLAAVKRLQVHLHYAQSVWSPYPLVNVKAVRRTSMRGQGDS